MYIQVLELMDGREERRMGDGRWAMGDELSMVHDRWMGDYIHDGQMDGRQMIVRWVDG